MIAVEWLTRGLLHHVQGFIRSGPACRCSDQEPPEFTHARTPVSPVLITQSNTSCGVWPRSRGQTSSRVVIRLCRASSRFSGGAAPCSGALVRSSDLTCLFSHWHGMSGVASPLLESSHSPRSEPDRERSKDVSERMDRTVVVHPPTTHGSHAAERISA